ncbi:MAG: tetratricopeptide repeat protein [Alphaproteobacteria bacterium]|nr:tetratricopeptide repeat protein [Alphaproteobacteria bacterium]
MDDEPVRPVAVAAISRLCARAAQAREAGRLEAARNLLTQASAAARIQTAARHEVAVNFNNLAAAYATVQRHDDAIELLRAALAVVPEYALAHANLADLLKRQGRTDAGSPRKSSACPAATRSATPARRSTIRQTGAR